jgi:hypothetical protein
MLALGLFVWSLCLVLRHPHRLIPAALSLGLAVSANLTPLIPAAALTAALAGVPIRLFPVVRFLTVWLAVAAVFFLLVLAAPLLAAHYAFGTPFPYARAFTGSCRQEWACWYSSLDPRFRQRSRPVCRRCWLPFRQAPGTPGNTRNGATMPAPKTWPGRYRASIQPPPARIRVAADWHLEPSLNFYRKINGWDWLSEIRREDDGQPGFDLYVILLTASEPLQRLNLTVVYRHPESGAMLALPGKLPLISDSVAAGFQGFSAVL